MKAEKNNWFCRKDNTTKISFKVSITTIFEFLSLLFVSLLCAYLLGHDLLAQSSVMSLYLKLLQKFCKCGLVATFYRFWHIPAWVFFSWLLTAAISTYHYGLMNNTLASARNCCSKSHGERKSSKLLGLSTFLPQVFLDSTNNGQLFWTFTFTWG